MKPVSGREVESRLLRVLRTKVDPHVSFAAPPTPLTGGASSEMYQFELTAAPPEWSTKLVLRMVPFSVTHVLVEAALQEGARAAGIPAPAVLLVEPVGEHFGVPYMVMQKLPGQGFVRGIQWHRFARSLPALIISWPDTFARVMTLLGRADLAPVLAALERYGLAEADALTTRHLAWVEEQLGEEAAFVDLLSWLQVHQPALPKELSLVHGDLWGANVLVRGKAMTGLVDWTWGAIGDPALDHGFARVGMALMPEPFPPPPPIRNVLRAAGVNIAGRMDKKTTRHESPDNRVAYFEVLRCALELAAVQRGRSSGRPSSWEHGVPALLAHVHTVTGLAVAFR